VYYEKFGLLDLMGPRDCMPNIELLSTALPKLGFQGVERTVNEQEIGAVVARVRERIV
jgi:hypothetical protein